MDFGDLSNDTKIKEKLLHLHTSIDDIEKILETILKDFNNENLSTVEHIHYDLFNAYSLNVLCWMYLRTKGQDPSNSQIKSELGRIKEYMFKARNAEILSKRIQPRLDKQVAERFIKHGISHSDKSENTKKRKHPDS